MRSVIFSAALLFAVSCSSKEGPQGPQGEIGPQGPAGAQGERGEAGETGAMGALGATGETGAQGPQGLQGAQGAVLVVDGGVLVGPPGSSVIVSQLTSGDPACATGGVRITQLADGGITNLCNGATGPVGEQGVAGPQGAPGAQGIQGPIGPQGSIGAQGMQGVAGPQGPVGATGAVGSTGPQGATGSQGVAGPQGPVGATGAVGSTGSQGATGPQGIQGSTGIQGPAGAAGVTASLLPSLSVQCVAGGVLLTFADGGTSAVCNGTQGSQGAQGAQGIQGPQGSAGAQGSTGATGSQGSAGPAGPIGATGPTGPPGSVYFVDGGVVNLNSDAVAFAGFTPTAYTGNLGGHTGANQKCSAAYPGSFFCTGSDFGKTETAVVPGGNGAWVDGERNSDGRRNSGYCSAASTGWTYEGTNINFKAYIVDDFGETGGSSQCAVSHPLACCSKN